MSNSFIVQIEFVNVGKARFKGAGPIWYWLTLPPDNS